MESLARIDMHTAKALLEWQAELGADEAIGDLPVNRFDAPESLSARSNPASAAPVVSAPQPAQMQDPVAVAQAFADRAGTLAELAELQEAYDLCDLKKGARRFVFADGNQSARVMVIGEAPGKDEESEGRPFVGAAGKMLDRMLAAIGLSRHSADAEASVYITNVVPWRPPHNREPTPEEVAMMRPFLARHVALVKPDLLVVMGNTACDAVLGKRGITRLRGAWTSALGLPALPMVHPSHLLQNPAAKRAAWGDLLSLLAKLREPK